MTDLNKEREKYLQWHFDNWKAKWAADDTPEFAKTMYDRIYQHFHADQIGERESGYEAWLGAKAQAVPEWISVEDRLPEEGVLVLFLDKHNTIHDGLLSTDYVDGPYGENGEDLGDNQTLWTSNSNGEELLLSEVKYWMHRPSSPSASESGAER